MTTDSSDETPKKKPLSEIGHLFLSSVRDLNGTQRPQRIPPGGVARDASMPAAASAADQHRADLSIDLTPEEFAQVYGNDADAAEADDASAQPASVARIPAVTAIIGEHLNGKQLVRVKEYARHLAATNNQRVGLIELDASEFRLMCFEPGEQSGGGHVAATAPVEQASDCYDPRVMAEAIEEMNFDVDRWLLLVPTPRVPEAAPLLKLVDHWLLLSTCDHDGIVASYRMLKGMSELHRPRMTLAVLDATSAAQAAKVHGKLSGVCAQFLDRSLEAETPVQKGHQVCEHLVLLCRPTRDKAQLANPPQWDIVQDFLVRAAECRAAEALAATAEAANALAAATDEPARRELVSEMVVPAVEALAAEVMTMSAELKVPEMTAAAAPVAAPAMTFAVAATLAPATPTDEALGEILDLPCADATADDIVGAVLKQDGCAMLECPVRPPMCAEARLAVTRDRSVVLLAVAKRGLSELNAIGQAYRWLIENRSLIGMAVPQLAIDAGQTPQLRLLVDECDAGAEVLRPMLTGSDVTVQSYRRVKWGGKAGLLLAAA